MDISTSDWKVFRRRVPEWRERYLRLRNEELVGLLRDGAHTPTERFWRAKERVAAEAHVLTACLDGHSKGKVAWYLSLMYGHGMIGDGDLDAFSEGLREAVRASHRLTRGAEPDGS
ncbi:MAG: hypothetical protein ABJF88_05345 [Rhodothermales bacterium]